ncbi:MAG: DUF1631 family protein [Endozoicomonas sp.]
MATRDSNVVELNPKHPDSPLGEINGFFIQLIQSHIFPIVDETLSRLVEYLVEKSDCAENNSRIMRLMEVKSQLQKARREISEHYSAYLMTNFDLWETPETEDDLETREAELSLLENTELEHCLAWQAAAKQLRMDESFQYLVNIEGRLATLMTVIPELNPIGPLRLCESFAKALPFEDKEIGISRDLLIQFALAIKPSVAELWQEADSFLESLGLELTNPTIAINSAPPPALEPDNRKTSTFSPFASGEETGAEQDEFMESIALKIASHMESMMTTPGSGDQVSDRIEIRVAAADLAGALTSIQEELIQQQTSIFTMSESIQAALDNRGMKQNMSPRHLDLINVIGMLFEFILEDHQLPHTIKNLIGHLQIPVLKQALLDKEFLVNRHHPARELLNSMISAGMHLINPLEEDEPVMLMIEKTVKQILKGFSNNPDIFEECLQSFTQEILLINEKAQESEQLLEIHELERASQEQDEKHLENLLHECIADYTVPSSLEELIHHGWLSVLKHISAKRSYDLDNWFHALNTLDMLLWNFHEDNHQSVSFEDWQQLKQNIQNQLHTAHHDQFQIANWMFLLNKLIADPTGKEDLDEEEIVIESEESRAANPENRVEVQPEKPPEPSPDEHQVSSETHSINNDEQHPECTQEVNPACIYHQLPISERVHTCKLHAGMWVEFVGNGGRRLRCKLSTIIRESDRYIFVNCSGMKVVEWSGYELEREISEGKVTILEENQFFERALHAVMDNFLKF